MKVGRVDGKRVDEVKNVSWCCCGRYAFVCVLRFLSKLEL